MTSPVRKVLRKITPFARKVFRPVAPLIRPLVKDPLHFTNDDLINVGRDDHRCFEAMRHNLGANGKALYSVLHVSRLVRWMMAQVNFDFRGKSVLEMGGSPDPGLPLTMLLHGVGQYHSANVVKLERTLHASSARMIWLLLTSLLDYPSDRLDQVVEWIGSGPNTQARLRDSCFQLFSETGAEDLKLADNSLDCIWSVSVLEHVSKPQAVIENCYRMLKPGGWFLSTIDLRDHSKFADPLGFLRLSESDYIAKTGGSENRLRASYFLNTIPKAGFEITQTRFQDFQLALNETGTTEMLDLVFSPIESICPKTSLDAVNVWMTERERQTFVAPFDQHDLRDLSIYGMMVFARKPG